MQNKEIRDWVLVFITTFIFFLNYLITSENYFIAQPRKCDPKMQRKIFFLSTALPSNLSFSIDWSAFFNIIANITLT